MEPGAACGESGRWSGHCGGVAGTRCATVGGASRAQRDVPGRVAMVLYGIQEWLVHLMEAAQERRRHPMARVLLGTAPQVGAHRQADMQPACAWIEAHYDT